MKATKILRSLSVFAVAIDGLFACAPAVFAQGCALCYNNAAATGPQGQAALRHGILILMIPPMLIFAALMTILYRRRNAHHDAIRPVTAQHSIRAVSEIVLHLD